VLTVTSSTSIDSYFATKLAKLRSKAEKDNSTSETVLPEADTVFTNKREQTDQQLTLPTSSGTGLAADCDTLTVKQCKKKRKKVDNIDGDCHTNDKHLHFQSFNSNTTSKKKKRHVADLSEVTVECSNSGQNVKTCRKKKGRPSTTETSILNHSEQTSVRLKTKKKKKLTHDAS